MELCNIKPLELWLYLLIAVKMTHDKMCAYKLCLLIRELNICYNSLLKHNYVLCLSLKYERECMTYIIIIHVFVYHTHTCTRICMWILLRWLASRTTNAFRKFPEPSCLKSGVLPHQISAFFQSAACLTLSRE